jgi:hypothetical protein
LIRDGHDCSFSSSHSLLSTTNGDGSSGAIVLRASFDVDLGISLVLDLVNRCTTLAENTGNGTSRNRELEDVVRFLLKFSGLEEGGRNEAK